MRAFTLALLMASTAACTTTDHEEPMTASATTQPSATIAVPAYVETRRVDVVDTQAGIEIPDPYRWLENDVREDAEVAAWVAAQNAVTEQVLDALPARDWFEKKTAALIDYERIGVPEEKGGRYFYSRNDGLQNQDVLYVREGLDGAPRVLIDPNQWEGDGTTALASSVISEDGTKLVYSIQKAGSDWRTLRVLDVDSGAILDDEIEWAMDYGLNWDKTGEGFYYVRRPAPKEGEAFQAVIRDAKIFYHKLGDDPADDRLIFEDPERPNILYQGGLSEDGNTLFLIGFDGKSPGYELSYLDLTDETLPQTYIYESFDHKAYPFGDEGSIVYIATEEDAPNQKIVAYDMAAPEKGLVTVVPEQEQRLSSASMVGGKLFASYLVDAKTEVRVFDADGTARGTVDLPGLGVASGFGGENDATETFFGYSSFNQPPSVYRMDLTDGSVTQWTAPKLNFDPDAISVEQVFYASKDGTRVPMFIVKRKDVTTPAPTLLYAYGGFDATMSPSYSTSRMSWIEAGGVYVLANIRGGGEYGKKWHDGGRRFNKQNVFDDFIAAGEALVASGVTTKEQLAIQGGSNGGLLIGAVLNQRPDLFAAAVPEVGVMDMTRFHKFTSGVYWINDYGDPEDAEMLRYLLGYSPYHNVRAEADYPAVLVTTADTDDRVVPGHSFKYAAAMQAAAGDGDGPILIRIETSAGHGSGKPTDKIIQEIADKAAFMAYYTGLNPQAE
ncbi:prolyl oligopeptidase family serine peptidase [Sphingomicrobium nitratireducens]|uniref:prolyl oligopeptidase family serine peptidase n=1 Tax=Sphingomicrobium nitratireducens TaxID=2964666 RepID=UPI00223EB1E6|nr:prolyl oligopeptidase family serine peptidase [Sphingomicrobium nitratireducens]